MNKRSSVTRKSVDALTLTSITPHPVAKNARQRTNMSLKESWQMTESKILTVREPQEQKCSEKP